MGTTRINVALVLICSACILTSAPAVSAATNNGGFSVRPGEFNPNDPVSRAYFKPILAPGASATRHVVVTNLGSAPLHLLVDPVDGLTGQTSGSVYANRQDPATKAGLWLTPAIRSVTIGARGTASVPFTISVPRSATPGDHLAGIAFQNTATNSSAGSFAVKQIIREVVGVLVKVPGPASKEMSIGTLALQSLPGTAFASVIVNLSNAGQLLCKPSLNVSLDGPNGRSRTVTRALDTVLPGDTIAYPLPWPDSLSAGRYVARASTSGCGPAFTISDVPLVLGAPLNGTQQPATAPAHHRIPILWLVLAFGLTLAGILLGLLIGKRRRREEPELVPVSSPRIPVHANAGSSTEEPSGVGRGQQSLWP